MTNDITIGDRVEVSPQYHWAMGATGTVGQMPGSRENECFRYVDSLRGPLKFVWVLFDVPHLDADRDGPYDGGEIDANYLTKL